ncbi:phage/plasmid primase, P4 family [Pimelobacter simplex]|uniref:DNA primase family protein n=1 Tax=Nocardioides simplex TaxID=2045 RepID=UPI00366C9BFA
MSAGGFGQNYPDVDVPPPDQFADPPKLKVAQTPDGTDLHHSQVRIAYRLARRCPDELMFVHGLGWHYWDGRRWVEDAKGHAVRAVLEELRIAIAESFSTGDTDFRKDVHKCETSRGVAGVLDLASSLEPFAVTTDELDKDPYLFNTHSGTLDLRTLDLKPHNPADRLTKVASCDYDPTATGETFTAFINEVLPDPDVRKFVQTLFGLALIGKVLEHVLPIFTGVGRNGKSTLLNVVRACMGDYAIEVEPDLLIERDRAHPTGLLDLRGARLAVCQESDEGRKLAVGTVKRLTGGDPIRARRMRADFVQFDPSHTSILVTNHKPRVPGDDPALWRRLRVVPFDVVVPNPDANLPDRLDLERDVVLAWAIQGLQAYGESGLQAPAAVQAATDTYRASSDVLGRFMEERTYRRNNDGVYVRAGDLFADWQSWCARNGEHAGRQNEFAEAVARLGVQKVNRSIGRVYVGLGLVTDREG